jgi:hypothetical protein
VRRLGEVGEPDGVHVAALDGQPVARRRALHGVGSEHPPQPRDVGLHRGIGIGRGSVAPQLLRDAVERHRAARLGQQQTEQDALQGTAEVE